MPLPKLYWDIHLEGKLRLSKPKDFDKVHMVSKRQDWNWNLHLSDLLSSTVSQNKFSFLVLYNIVLIRFFLMYNFINDIFRIFLFPFSRNNPPPNWSSTPPVPFPDFITIPFCSNPLMKVPLPQSFCFLTYSSVTAFMKKWSFLFVFFKKLSIKCQPETPNLPSAHCCALFSINSSITYHTAWANIYNPAATWFLRNLNYVRTIWRNLIFHTF